MEKFFIYFIALLPGIGIALYIYFMDKDEPEPIRLVIMSFFLGVLSFGLDLILVTPLGKTIHLPGQHLKVDAISAFGASALVEESCKFIFILIFLYRNTNFNEPLDGIIYSVMVAMGFATAENILYAYSGGGGVVILRMFSAIPAHALFGVLMGYMLGKAKFTNKHVLYAMAALGVATLFHGVYDYFLFLSYAPGLWIVSLIAMVVAFFLSKHAIEIDQRVSPFHHEDK